MRKNTKIHLKNKTKLVATSQKSQICGIFKSHWIPKVGKNGKQMSLPSFNLFSIVMENTNPFNDRLYVWSQSKRLAKTEYLREHFFVVFWDGSCCVVSLVLNSWDQVIFPSQPPHCLGLQVCTTVSSSQWTFLNFEKSVWI